MALIWNLIKSWVLRILSARTISVPLFYLFLIFLSVPFSGSVRVTFIYWPGASMRVLRLITHSPIKS